MRTSELDDVEALVGQVLPDPTGFAERLLQQLMDRLAGSPAVPEPTIVTSHEASAFEEFADRNVLLAAALGACDCWGQRDDCPVCGGQGSAGWALPDSTVYAEYVIPAVLRMSADASSKDSNR